MPDKKTLLIGIAGGSGSGKTTICRQLVERLGDLANVISSDNYYLSQSHLEDAERAAVNFDHPDVIDFDLLANHLDRLARGHAIEMPEYCFATHSRLGSTTTITPKPITIVEGILLYANPTVSSQLDLLVFVDAPDQVRYERRLARDVAERGRTPESVAQQWKETVAPMYDKYVAATKNHAHVTINTEVDSAETDRAITVLADGLQSMAG